MVMSRKKKEIKFPKAYVIDDCEISVKKTIKNLDKLTGKYFKKSTKSLKKIMSSSKYKNSIKKVRVKTEVDVNKLLIRVLLKLNNIDERLYFDEDDNVISPNENFTDISALDFGKHTSSDKSIYFKKKYLTFVYLNALTNIKRCEKKINKTKNNTKDDMKIKSLKNYSYNLIKNTDKVMNKNPNIDRLLSIPYNDTINENEGKEIRRKNFSAIIRKGFKKNNNADFNFTKEGYEGIGIWLIFNNALYITTGKKMKYKYTPRHFANKIIYNDYRDEIRMLGHQIRKYRKDIQKPFVWYLICYPLILSNYSKQASKDDDLYMGLLALSFTAFYIGSKEVRKVVSHLINFESRRDMKEVKKQNRYLENLTHKKKKVLNKQIDEIVSLVP